MAQRREELPINEKGEIQLDEWIDALHVPKNAHQTIREACQLAFITGGDKKTRFGSTCFLQGLELAEIVAELNLDADAIAAAALFSTFKHTDLKLDDIKQNINKDIAKLLQGLIQMGAINLTHQKVEKQSSQQIDNVRKMILAMASDIRIVVIKLADRLCLMRELKHYPDEFRQHIAQESLDIFAPLANRLGLQHIKWELEDLAFFSLDPESYKTIAKQLDERRVDREKRVNEIVDTLKHLLKEAGIEASVYGRAKHIYSIKRKMDRKNIAFHHIYDAIAVRILAPHVSDCYKTLSIVHKQWEPVPEEFDDYINRPKQNGYQSIHTAVTDANQKKFEIQIRTQDMHNCAELGISAHWKYKEDTAQEQIYEEKINWLRQILAWQKELQPNQQLSEHFEQNIFKDRIYVFTPENDIIDLSIGSTPLDFAYHIHTQVGHHCQGAKVNGKIVPLTSPLKMGDRIEILTSRKATPSRDWLSPSHGYLNTSHAKAKVLQWFKQQQFEKQISEGRTLLEKELKRLSFHNINLAETANRLNLDSIDSMLAGLGSGTIKIHQLVNLLTAPKNDTEPTLPEIMPLRQFPKKAKHKTTIKIQGLDHLLTKIAKCCKPIPGDPIIGYITQNQGITIHHAHCKNIVAFRKDQPDRLVEANWNIEDKQFYPVDIEISAYDYPQLGREATMMLLNDKINILKLSALFNRKNNLHQIIVTLEISHLSMLDTIIRKLSTLNHVLSVKRL